MEYKDTLLMPKTEFPMRGNLPKREPEIQEKWEEMNIYKIGAGKNKRSSAFHPYMMDLHMQMVIFIWGMH